mmetsp:Transcript_28863/g.61793  ORF Transcript_28863/g.61793 Transcript_28863/m.61793 type:complete len:230 (-) Transcript_28863:218-907(-)
MPTAFLAMFPPASSTSPAPDPPRRNTETEVPGNSKAPFASISHAPASNLKFPSPAILPSTPPPSPPAACRVVMSMRDNADGGLFPMLSLLIANDPLWSMTEAERTPPRERRVTSGVDTGLLLGRPVVVMVVSNSPVAAVPEAVAMVTSNAFPLVALVPFQSSFSSSCLKLILRLPSERSMGKTSSKSRNSISESKLRNSSMEESPLPLLFFTSSAPRLPFLDFELLLLL